MQNPFEITFHNMAHNDKVETVILEKFENVKEISSDVTKCHVIIEKLSHHHQNANRSVVRIDLKVPHIKDIVISEKCSEDEASLLSTTLKVFKRSKILLREEIARIRDRNRAPKNVNVEVEVEDEDEGGED